MGAEKRYDDLPVIAGNDAEVYMEPNELIAWATDLSIDEDFELQGIRTLGVHGDRGFKSVGYNCNFNVGSFVLNKKALETLPYETRSTILKSGLINFFVKDKVTGEVILKLKYCKLATHNRTFAANDMAKRTTTWRAREVLEVDGK